MPLPGLHLLAVLGVLAATAKKPSSGGSSYFLIFLIVIAGAYFLFIAPQRRKQRAQLGQQRSFEVGDEVVTTGGIYGRVESSDGDRVALDISEGVIIEVARTAIARRIDPTVTTEEASEPALAADEEEPGTGDGSEHGWDPPRGEEQPGTNGVGAGVNGTGEHGDWADPWGSSTTDGEQGATGAAGGSA